MEILEIIDHTAFSFRQLLSSLYEVDTTMVGSGTRPADNRPRTRQHLERGRDGRCVVEAIKWLIFFGNLRDRYTKSTLLWWDQARARFGTESALCVEILEIAQLLELPVLRWNSCRPAYAIAIITVRSVAMII